MRIACLLPGATEIVCQLGLQDAVVGITHECDYPPGIEREKPVLIESCLGPGGKDLPPGEIDRRIKESLRSGAGVYRIRRELFLERARKPGELAAFHAIPRVPVVPYP